MRDPFGCDDPSLLTLGVPADGAAARRAVAARATGPEDLARLLDILGLLPAAGACPAQEPEPQSCRTRTRRCPERR
ncbi:hypothetical protein E6U81_25705 [Streptomyces sp. A0592]|nr:hypothetical protein E6U81_25705 [Streptomyces sp. A0592]